MKPPVRSRIWSVVWFSVIVAGIEVTAQTSFDGQSGNLNPLQRMMTDRYETNQTVSVYDQHIQKAYSYLAEGNFNEGYRYLNYAMKEDPTRAESYVGFAIAARAKKQYPAAERALRKAMEVDPDNARVRHEMARLLLIKKVPEEALSEIDQAIEIDQGKDWNTQQVRAEVLMELGRIQEAAALYERVEDMVKAKLSFVKRAINAESSKVELVGMGKEYELVNDLQGNMREIEVLRFDTVPKDAPEQWFRVRDRLERSLTMVQARRAEVQGLIDP